MDFLDFSGEAMYFDRPPPTGVQQLIDAAGAEYGSETAELKLLRAYFLAPNDLTVLVALYRYYYYRREYADALTVADRAIVAASRELGVDEDWRALTDETLAEATRRSMPLTRFIMLALKGAGYLLLRMDRPAPALERLQAVAAFDTSDRLGVRELLDWAQRGLAREEVANAGDNVSYIHDPHTRRPSDADGASDD